MFYLLVFSSTLLDMSSTIHRLIYPVAKKNAFNKYTVPVRSVNFACIFMTDALTMYSLAISVQVVQGMTTQEKSNCRHSLAYTLGALFLLGYVIAEIVIFNDKDEAKILHYARASITGTIILTSTCILLYLKAQFNKFGAFDTRKAQRSIVI